MTKIQDALFLDDSLTVEHVDPSLFVLTSQDYQGKVTIALDVKGAQQLAQTLIVFLRENPA